MGADIEASDAGSADAGEANDGRPDDHQCRSRSVARKRGHRGHQTWADYEELLQRRQDNPAIKVRYNARTQEIRLMTPLPGARQKLRRAVRSGEGSPAASWARLAKFRSDHVETFRRGRPGTGQVLLHREPRGDLGKTDRPGRRSATRSGSKSTPPRRAVPTITSRFASPRCGSTAHAVLDIYVFDGQHYREVQREPNLPGNPVRELIPEYIAARGTPGQACAAEFDTALRGLQDRNESRFFSGELL